MMSIRFIINSTNLKESKIVVGYVKVGKNISLIGFPSNQEKQKHHFLYNFQIKPIYLHLDFEDYETAYIGRMNRKITPKTF